MNKVKPAPLSASSNDPVAPAAVSRQNRKAKRLKSHTRVQGSLLSALERRALLWMAARLPQWVSPDILTGLGVLGGVIIFAGFILSNVNKYYLALASFGFIINWLGDSLDGTVARYRKIERPKYGFFIDHSLDSLIIAFIFMGAGLSPFVNFEIATFALIGYLLLAIHTFITTYVMGEFKISYAMWGPTEARVLAIIGNTVMMALLDPFFDLYGYAFTFYDLIAIFIGLVTFVSFVVYTIKKGIILSREDRQSSLMEENKR
jgi:archaetidylinositol phosphate synthase